MKTCSFFVASVLYSSAALAGALVPKPIDIVDLVVDGKNLSGEMVTVGKCQIQDGGSLFMRCRVPGAQFFIDAQSLEKDALKRSMRLCHAGFVIDDLPECTATVTGIVQQHNNAIQLHDATIVWAKP